MQKKNPFMWFAYLWRAEFSNGKKITQDPEDLYSKHNSKAEYNPSSFRDFLDYSVHVARQGCKELKEGYVAASPYEGSCDYCKYGGMCGFNKDCAQPRKEPNVDTGMIAKIARKKREGENNV